MCMFGRVSSSAGLRTSPAEELCKAPSLQRGD